MISNSSVVLFLLALGLISRTVWGQPVSFPESSPILEEVLVTAQHRSQDSQRVPISLDVFDSEALNRGGLHSLPDLADELANVEMFEDYGGQGLPVWVIRGVGLQDFNANNTSTAAVYVDEVYQASAAQGSSGLFDTDRVEVLKGPQGGLYGRNTTGGVVRQVTRRALLDEREGYVSAYIGSWQERGLEFASNHPLGQSTAVRIAGRRVASSDAWQHSLADNTDHGEKDLWDLRSWWLFQPSQDLRFDLKLYAGQNQSELPLARSIGVYDANGNFCAAALAGRRDDSSCLSYAGMLAAQSGSDPATVSPSRQRRDGSTSLSNAINQLNNRQAGATGFLAIDSDFAGGILTEFIVNYERFDYGFTFDYDGSPAELGHQITASEIEVHSQELRVTSTAAGRLDWQVGVISSRERFIEDRQFRLQDNLPVGLIRGQLDYTQLTRSRAAWGSLSLALTDHLTASASLRYTDASKDYRDGSVRAPLLPPPSDIVVDDMNARWQLGSNWSGSLGLTWTPNERVMLYASASQAYKSGGFFGGFVFAPGEFAPYDEETVHAYESGIKLDSSDRRLRLNASVFYYDYRDVQGFVNARTGMDGDNGELVLERLRSLGDATHSGVETAVVWVLSQWELRVAAGYLDARIDHAAGKTFNAAGEEVSTKGRRGYAPRWNGSVAATHFRPLTSASMLQMTVSANYRSDFSPRLTSPVDEAVGHLPGYWLVNADVAVVAADDTWRLSVWVENLANKTYSPRKAYDSLGSYIELMGQPRSYGMQLQLKW